MTPPHDVVFLHDVDDTLLDNDQIERDLWRHLEQAFGVELQARYWEIFEKLRTELGYAGYLGALQRYRLECLRDPHLLETSLFLVDYPFGSRVYPGALDVIARLRGWGPTVILSDGDVVFQPRKVARSGLWEAVAGHVLIYIHKEQMLEDVEHRYPAHHYADVARIWRAHRSGLLKRSLRAVAGHAGRGRTRVAIALWHTACERDGAVAPTYRRESRRLSRVQAATKAPRCTKNAQRFWSRTSLLSWALAYGRDGRSSPKAPNA